MAAAVDRADGLPCVSTNSGLLALLDEEPKLQAYALEQLNSSGLVESHWAEIADEIVKL